ncbi:aldehyde dehydrogenase family protein [Paracoccus denitrificans]|jgi:aldehyde dehydrogenase (NAD+)|uniref:Aldehyde dehydrogenase n=1 Tax=Paracoccus denitrificans (strain Pd 1222) TaxID=318586 RepID=A1BBY7_PARDP|nr:aldehyde dehydrogenase [Paracoccus denitrificans]ABL73031.1 aldehyde dehydrogenase [Paracoccus denitrificans PD1222]MBB4628407.1 aldehyde dehydrogenase (NAD+) [Paracoccus denitrificans]MCU7429619.1 aldehyde dehydrogenase family protein [Paracoccus denitrificans]QAR29424.1 aldehyde dehydrogenase [Paracoccus denitrificans]UPV98247.1 aldehyde dehydrogenase family protein [Paracoccus denitrificans]
MTRSFDPDTLDLPRGHFIAGEHVADRGRLAMHRPSDGAAFGESPVADADMVDRAVAAGRAALAASGWGCGVPRDRTRALLKWADLIEAEAETLARFEAACSTRPVAQLPVGDIAVTAEQIRFFAEMADKEGSDLVPTRDASLGMTVDEPYGVVGAITPWNFPLSMAGWKLAPALAAGNAVVLKPSEMTPFSTLYMAELSVRAGIPAGLVNVVLGDGPVTGNAITGHPGIGKVSFTGSTGAGQAIMGNIARNGVKPMTLELGGKSPQIVFADADLDLAADCIARSITFNAGQACVAGSRVLVAAEIAEALAERLIARMADHRPGTTWDAETQYSPIISERQIARIDGIVQAAVAQGAEVLAGAARLDHPGWFYAPTLLAGVAPDSPAVTEEIFGPVLTLEPFADEEQAVAMADHPTYGLCAGIFTRDLSCALRVMRRIEAGTVWINRYGRSRDHILPTGGYKSSGIGKDLGRAAYHANRRQKSVLIDL